MHEISLELLPHQIWRDYRLAWNASEFSNINDLAFEKNSIWTPDMAIYNKYVYSYAIVFVIMLGIQEEISNI